MNRPARFSSLAAVLIGAASCIAPWSSASAAEDAAESKPVVAKQLSYNDDIRPILADHCFACHGPDSASREAGLRLDKRESAIDMMAIVPGDPEASSMIDRIGRPADDDMAMPPIDGHERLSKEDQALLTQWVLQGAEYQAHWSWIPPERPEIPAVQNKSWARNPIDSFVLARLESAGLAPAEEADRRTLARRLSLDLTGLPPTPEQVEAFVRDESPDYYEKYVDRLLESVRWGEHRGRYWLDYARYADTHGIHFDNYREMWAYRDWIIDAFNRNQPFDQFSIEQLAGDLLPDPTMDQLIATGFNRCNITTNEGGIIDEEYKVLYARDRTETTSAVWLGLTTGCAVCHDHKFDPITAADFYSLSAFFNNTTQPVRDGNVADTPPIIPVPLAADQERWLALPAEIAAAGQTVSEARAAARQQFDQRAGEIAASAITDTIPSDSLMLHAPLSSGAGPAVVAMQDDRLTQQIAAEDHVWAAGHTAPTALEVSANATVELPKVGDFERDQAFSVSAWVWLPTDNTGGSIVARMDDGQDFRGWDVWLEGNRLAAHLIHKWPENALKISTGPPLKKEQWTHVAVTYDGTSRPEGLRFFVDGREQTERNVASNQLSETIRTSVPFKVGTRNNTSRTVGLRLNDLRVYGQALSGEQCGLISRGSRAAYLAARPAQSRSDAEKDELFAWWMIDHAPELQQRIAAEQQLIAERDAIRDRGTIAHIMQEAEGPATAFILERGEYDQHGEQVTADTPSALPPMDESLPKNRLGLAKWLFSDDHPLTARVTVNRFWQEVFGVGFVDTPGDFGIMGSRPSHPELLDYLAVEFRDSGWDVKELFRQIVTSATYRQSAVASPEKRGADLGNRLLSRGPRMRMDAEMLRDHALFVSGLLSPTVGGPSVRPYQPIGVWEAVAMPGSNTRDYVQDSGEALYRRSMYTFWKRSAPPAAMDVLNAPSREVCTVQRDRTNTPLQALVTLNATQFVEAARMLATRVLHASSVPEIRIQEIFLRALSRPATSEELAIVNRSLETLTSYYSTHPDDALALVSMGESPVDQQLNVGELAAWTMLSNQLLNLDEVLNK